VLDDATLIEVETSLQEHASAANLPVYVKLLKDCQRNRTVHAARDALLRAIQAGRPATELRKMAEAIEASPFKVGKHSLTLGFWLFGWKP
jgi:hypothetical protein